MRSKKENRIEHARRFYSVGAALFTVCVKGAGLDALGGDHVTGKNRVGDQQTPHP